MVIMNPTISETRDAK